MLRRSGTLRRTGVMALSWEPGRDRTLTLGLVLVAMLCSAVRQRLRRMQRNRE